MDFLLASSAIPALLKPVEIDGDLYVDGGAAVGVPIFRVDAIERTLELWRERHPGERAPKIRFWILINNKIGVRPMVTQTRWSDVLLRSYKIALQSSLVPPIFALSNEVSRIDGDRSAAEIEVRWAAIPEDFNSGPEEKAFDPAQMQELSVMGGEMGRNPVSWRTEPPNF